jgi:transposase-like protein
LRHNPGLKLSCIASGGISVILLATDFLLTAKGNAAAKRFFLKTLKAVYTGWLRVITVDKNPVEPKVIKKLIADKQLPEKHN